jgi:[ribosomal protein S5]-alanine N-acetyltransferase
MHNLNFSNFPVFHTDRLKIRQLTDEDANQISVIRSNEIVNQFLNRPKNTSIEDATVFINDIKKRIENKESLYWAISMKENNTLIGTTCLFNFNPEKRMAEIGYELHPDFHGKGIMNEVIATTINYGFTELNLRTIIALTKPENKNSISLLTKNNFLLDKDFELVNREETADYAVYYLTNKDVA